MWIARLLLSIELCLHACVFSKEEVRSTFHMFFFFARMEKNADMLFTDEDEPYELPLQQRLLIDPGALVKEATTKKNTMKQK